MATLSVSEVLHHPDIIDNFIVERRTETIDVHGRSVVSVATFIAHGVVTANTPNGLDRPPDYEQFARSLVIVTQFQLQGATTGKQPDIVLWQSSRYLVKAVDRYPHFGEGFYQIECESIEHTDNESNTNSMVGKLLFNNVGNSQYIGLL